jgi:hypothetical protein
VRGDVGAGLSHGDWTIPHGARTVAKQRGPCVAELRVALLLERRRPHGVDGNARTRGTKGPAYPPLGRNPTSGSAAPSSSAAASWRALSCRLASCSSRMAHSRASSCSSQNSSVLSISSKADVKTRLSKWYKSSRRGWLGRHVSPGVSNNRVIIVRRLVGSRRRGLFFACLSS